MRQLLAIAAVLGALAVSVGPAFAASPGAGGQPSQTCLSSTAPSEPGHAALAPGSAFNETGPGTAGTVYAGNGRTLTTPANAAAVSQYDVACFQVSQH
jgi:hypothetical protein